MGLARGAEWPLLTARGGDRQEGQQGRSLHARERAERKCADAGCDDDTAKYADADANPGRNEHDCCDGHADGVADADRHANNPAKHSDADRHADNGSDANRDADADGHANPHTVANPGAEKVADAHAAARGDASTANTNPDDDDCGEDATTEIANFKF